MDKMQEDIVALWMVSGVIDLLLWNYIDGVYIPQLLCFCVIIKHFFFFLRELLNTLHCNEFLRFMKKEKKKFLAPQNWQLVIPNWGLIQTIQKLK